MHIQEIALNFVNSLVPGKFEDAIKMLSPNCVYSYKNTMLTGEKIVQSFIDNHKSAQNIFDKVEYLDGRISHVEESTVTVIVQDKLLVDNEEHIYTDRLILTIHDSLISAIENSPFEEEHQKVESFLKKKNIII